MTSTPAASLVDRLAEELARRWREGERPVVEEYLALHPELRADPEAAVELIYEELCLRNEHGQPVEEAGVLARFPEWRERLRVLLECHHLLEARPATPQFPAPGDRVGDFRLLAELGRGGQGRVFLASQPDLADRPVVLKLVPRSGGEHLSLARLQHSHIVPLYSVQEDPARDLRTLCMPYFGSATLARLLELLRATPPVRRTGGQVVEALRQAQRGVPLPVAVEGPTCRFLERASYVQAICWLGICLADALQYTHEHGLVHLDLKPSNVLWAADGQPMLLDLHLARAPLAAGDPAPAWLGGTPAYMAPEHRLALEAVREGRAVPVAVDGRADVYTLGLLLREALTGTLPPGGRGAGGGLRQNPQVSLGLADILVKCLADDPGKRYPEAAAVAADLRRHLADLPLRGVRNRSLRERWRKWRRRRPSALPLLALGLTFVLSGGIALTAISRESARARAALEEGEEHLRRHKYAEARNAWQRGLDEADGVPFHDALAEELRGRLRLVERVEAAGELHQLIERARVLYGADGQPVSEVRTVEAHCRACWQKRDLIARQLGGEPGPEREQVRTDLLDLAVLWTDLRVRLAGQDEARTVRQVALETLAEAEALFGPSCVLQVERDAHRAALGLPGSDPAGVPAPKTAWEHYAVGRAKLRAGDLKAAAGEFEQAAALEPQSFWANVSQGTCAYRQGRYEDAVTAFTVCVALAPDAAWCYCNRGLAHAALGRKDRALADYEHALRLDPGCEPARTLADELRQRR